ncbi:MAG: ATP-binding cassette domain-containing protein, partial [Christensenella sp.]
GVFGLMGAGRSTLARTIFGYYKPTAGTMKLEGKELNIKNCQDAISAGIAYLPSERKTEGLVLIQSIKDNIVMASLKKISGKSGVISKEKETQTAKKWIEKLGIKTPGDEVELRTLSGGNQQKVAIAKWLNTDCKVIIFNEPTRGIDVNAKYEVYKVMKEICAMGYGIIMISSELPEVLGIADRILVMRDGEIVAETEVNTTGQQELLQYALGN